jgi:hypothetical protein
MIEVNPHDSKFIRCGAGIYRKVLEEENDVRPQKCRSRRKKVIDLRDSQVDLSVASLGALVDVSQLRRTGPFFLVSHSIEKKKVRFRRGARWRWLLDTLERCEQRNVDATKRPMPQVTTG